MKKFTITGKNGKTVKIEDGKTYTVVYRGKKEWDFKETVTKIAVGAHHNYQNDNYIGFDDEEGVPHGDRFYFDGETAPKYEDHVIEILAVLPDDEAAEKLIG